jgi:protein-L-isoaspartate(D-aspartate) O-methyltransferase
MEIKNRAVSLAFLMGLYCNKTVNMLQGIMPGIFYRTVSARVVIFLVSALGCGFMLGLFLPPLVLAKTERVVTYEEAAVRKTPQNSPDHEFIPEAQKYDGPGFAAAMPIKSKEDWIAWMRFRNRDDDLDFMNERWALAQSFLGTAELKRPEDMRAFLLTPREHFVRARNRGFEYADTWLPIGYGATITDPDVVAMMTTTLMVKPGERVLEIGTGSGYQSAILSYLSTEVYTIEIIKPLFVETDKLYRDMEKTYPSYGSINRKLGDGYYGWDEYAPFDKIIVTSAIDHIPPPLLKQLKAGGIMVLPLGPPGRQYIMEVKKEEAADGTITLSRRDVYNGLRVSFIPFRDETGSSYSSSEAVQQ